MSKGTGARATRATPGAERASQIGLQPRRVGLARFALTLAVLGFGCCAYAQDSVKPWEEYQKLVDTRSTLATVGPDVFGDSVDLSTGTLSFTVTDISIPGNSALPVALTRTYKVDRRNGYMETSGGNVIGAIADGMLTDWDIDTPHISTIQIQNWRDTRCSVPAPPPTVNVGGDFINTDEYWRGYNVNMPGGGELLVANNGAPAPTAGGPYRWMTSGFTYFSCLPSIQNSSGEGFLAITADGTKYRFDWMAKFYEPFVKGAGGSYIAARNRTVLYATYVEDRFGNSVTYNYSNSAVPNQPGSDPTKPARLTSIVASDGRRISLLYDDYNHLKTATDGLKTWTYGYGYPSPTTGTLTRVTLPDTSTWSIDFAALSKARFRYRTVPAQQQEQYRSCTNPGTLQDEDNVAVAGTVTSPSGATGQFVVAPKRFGRSNVPLLCANYTSIGNNPNDDMPIYAYNWDAYALMSKEVSGPGLATGLWTYGYRSTTSFYYPNGATPVCTQSDGCIAPRCTSDDCIEGMTEVSVFAPEGKWTRYSFGNSYRYNEGKLLKVEEGMGDRSAPNATHTYKTTTSTYEFASSGQPFATPIASSLQPRGAGFSSQYLRPMRSRSIAQDGATFNQKITSYDAFARPLRVTRWSSLGHTRSDETSYFDQTSAWVLGQVQAMRNLDTNQVIAQTDFDPTSALPLRQYAFGKLRQTLAYNADGTVLTVKDGNNNVTTLGGWKRGIPQSIQYQDGTSESADVNDVGWVRSTTDENGYTTTYEYDDAGRVKTVIFPVDDTVQWNRKNTLFERVDSSEQGLAAGHWRQTVTQGAYRKTLLFDALWRPVVEQEEDTSDPNGTLRWTTKRYDALGRPTFASYPRNPYVDGWVNAGASINGTRTFYDELGRARTVEQDSELGVLVSTTSYKPGFVRETTNPRGEVTTEYFQAYDEPTMDKPVWIEAPEGVMTGIVRDIYSKPLEVVRAGPGG